VGKAWWLLIAILLTFVTVITVVVVLASLLAADIGAIRSASGQKLSGGRLYEEIEALPFADRLFRCLRAQERQILGGTTFSLNFWSACPDHKSTHPFGPICGFSGRRGNAIAI
jgi:hypothetical protein